MPLHLAPSRRRFLQSLTAGVLTVSLSPEALRAGEGRGEGASTHPASNARSDDNLIALINDTHIGEKHKPGIPIYDRLAATVDHLLKLPTKPAAVIINGDLALRDGLPGDYTVFARLIAPLREAGLPIHLTMGNHDDRDAFYAAFPGERRPDAPLLARHLAIVQTPHANFFLLDSLLKTMVAQGDLGQSQIHWLARALDAHVDKPAIVVAHHNPRFGGDPKHFPGGLIDSLGLWDALRPRKHVKAYIHGHIHDWSLASHEDIHIINTPATGYVADPKLSTTGWTMLNLGPAGMTVTTLTHIPDHPWNNASHELKWRA
jgi:hypothetical protein